jgi:hypothetical protein
MTSPPFRLNEHRETEATPQPSGVGSDRQAPMGDGGVAVFRLVPLAERKDTSGIHDPPFRPIG